MKKIKIGFIITSGAVFLFLLVLQVIKITKIFNDPATFNLFPVLLAVILLVVLLCHAGLYVLIMDSKKMDHVVLDEDEWWKKWDRV